MPLRAIQRRTRDAFLLVLMVPLLLGVVTFWAAMRNQQSVTWVVHTKDVLAQIDQVLLSVTYGQSAQRGYLLTDLSSFQQSFLRSKAEVGTELGELRQLTQDSRTQQRNLDELSAALTLRFDEMAAALELRRTGRLKDGEKKDAIRDGQVSMERIRAICGAMTQEEERLLAQRSAEQHKTAEQLAMFFGGAILVNLALLYWAYNLIRQYGLARDLAEFEIRHLNYDLEKRVQKRTAELESANERLLRSNEDLTRFAYIASHDLQEPLRTVGSYAGLLGRRYEGKLDEQADRYIKFIVDGAKRMQTMVRDLLEYSRVGTQDLNLQTVDLNVIVSQVKENLRAAIAGRHGAITSEPLPTVIGDPSKLAMVFQNLLSNALKFSKPEVVPKIHISSRQSESEWEISVRDNGIGFEPEFAQRIFILFQRLHYVGAYPGTGIGLAVCKRIVEGHGGKIFATSKLEEGSDFRFTLPLRPPEQDVNAGEGK